MATGVRVSFESVGLNAEEYQRFIDAGGIVMVSGEDCYDRVENVGVRVTP